MNKQKGFATILMVAIGLLVIGGGIYYFYSKPKSDFIRTEEKIIDIQETDIVQDSQNLDTIKSDINPQKSEEDIYQNGTYLGFIKSVYQNGDGLVFIDVDFFQTFGGKQAFLEAVKDYDRGKNEWHWDSLKVKYQTYSQLEKAIQAMSEEEFEEMYNNLFDGNSSGILGAFPNGFIYLKNESTKIRTFPLDKEATISVYDGIKYSFIELEKFMEKKEHFQNENDFYYKLFDFSITTKNGVVTKIVHYSRP